MEDIPGIPLPATVSSQDDEDKEHFWQLEIKYCLMFRCTQSEEDDVFTWKVVKLQPNTVKGTYMGQKTRIYLWKQWQRDHV